MNFENSDAEEPEAGFAAIHRIEFDEIDDADTAIALELLAARVQAARHCGA